MATAFADSTVTYPIPPKPLNNVNDLKNLLATIVKLDGTNCLLWFQSFMLYLSRKQHFFDAPPALGSADYNDWMITDACVMT